MGNNYQTKFHQICSSFTCKMCNKKADLLQNRTTLCSECFNKQGCLNNDSRLYIRSTTVSHQQIRLKVAQNAVQKQRELEALLFKLNSTTQQICNLIKRRCKMNNQLCNTRVQRSLSLISDKKQNFLIASQEKKIQCLFQIDQELYSIKRQSMLRADQLEKSISLVKNVLSSLQTCFANENPVSKYYQSAICIQDQKVDIQKDRQKSPTPFGGSSVGKIQRVGLVQSINLISPQVQSPQSQSGLKLKSQNSQYVQTKIEQQYLDLLFKEALRSSAQKQNQKAIENYTRIFVVDPFYKQTYVKLIQLLVQNDKDLAKIVCNQVSKLAQQNQSKQRIYYNLGIFLCEIRQFTIANHLFEQALKGGFTQAYFSLGYSYYQQNKYQQAARMLEILLQKNESQKIDRQLICQTWFNLGCVYNQLNKLQKAEQAFQKLLLFQSSQVSSSQVYFNLGIVQEKQNPAFAIVNYRKAFIKSDDPNFLIEVCKQLIKNLIAQGKKEEAINTVVVALKKPALKDSPELIKLFQDLQTQN